MSLSNPYKKQKNSLLRWHSLVVVGLTIFGAGIVWLIVRTGIRHSSVVSVPVYGDVVVTTLSSKNTLVHRVTELTATIASYDARLSELSALADENAKLKAELGRAEQPGGTLAHVITLPNRSFYDTFTIDAGSDDGIVLGQIAYAFGSIALGTVSNVSTHTSTIELYSSPGRATTGTAVGSDVSVTLTGRGGGEYEVRMPRDVHFEVGGMVAYQSVHTAVLARIERITTDPRDPFQKLLAKAPINLQALKWVIVK